MSFALVGGYVSSEVLESYNILLVLKDLRTRTRAYIFIVLFSKENKIHKNRVCVRTHVYFYCLLL